MNIDETYTDYYKGPVSDHFDGERFFNPWAKRPKKSFMDMLRWRMTGDRRAWPDHVDNAVRPAIEEKTSGLRATYIGHATFLVQMDGCNLLIDPLFSDRASPFAAIGPKRVRKPFVTIEELPPIDIVFVSHNHYDHMDLPSVAALERLHKPRFVTPLGNARLLKAAGVDARRITALDWHQVATLENGATLTLTPAQHWSRRGLDDTNRDLWGGFFLKQDGKSLYYSSDSGFYRPLFEDIRQRHGAPGIALLPIGAYEPQWFMKYSHMNPDEAWETHAILEAGRTMGFHHETLQLSDEAFDDARTRIETLAAATGAFLVPVPGDRIHV